VLGLRSILEPAPVFQQSIFGPCRASPPFSKSRGQTY
jgi:hypothetical protein